MLSRLSGARLTSALLISMGLLATCGGARTSVVVQCLQLADPTPGVVDALEGAARQSEEDAAWVIGLDRHYQKQDRCEEPA